MYSESNRKTASRRANDEFLRRMLGGELTGDGYPVMSVTEPVQTREAPVRGENNRVSCDGTVRPTTPDATDKGCPTTLHAPALAMVYSPRQCWRNLFDPATGLSKGTIFAELELPLEVVGDKREKEVKIRRPF